MTKTHYDPQRHHRRSIRLKGYDYSQPGAYFVTVVCQHRLCLLDPPPVRDMIQTWWDKLPEKFAAVETDEFVIMPNHIHGIIVITGPTRGSGQTRGRTHGFAPTPNDDTITVGAHPRVRPELGRIIQWFKTMTTNAYIHGVKQDGWEPFPGKLWQRNYYEHIIRNENALNRIRVYIENNPAQWEKDAENPNQRRGESTHPPEDDPNQEATVSTDFSKQINKADDDAKRLIIETLAGVETHGFDLDSVFFHQNKGWVVIEFLKCETVRPYESHPKRYWRKNWRKFAALWAIVNKLEGELWLVNYEDSREQFSVIHVLEMDPSATGGITQEQRTDTNFNSFRAWYRRLNDEPGRLW